MLPWGDEREIKSEDRQILYRSPSFSLSDSAAEQTNAQVVVEINSTITPLTPRATFALYGASGEILPVLISAVW